ncbi:UNVERIFIED_CONTAM: hypothetical protein Slati_1507900 [Sesamum latifolium]|uniref:Uncharacterized protein n=1 Tax=Sesamum latifolium TaxID=2727402 RepID=A0AAW2X5Z4_9LAMI
MQCWSAKKLSQVGHVVMIKSVLQAIPTFAMSCFKFPETGGRCAEVRRKEVLVRSLKDFNIALLCKWAWRIAVDTDNPVHRLFKARYFPTCSFVDAEGGGNISYAWRSILAMRPLLQVGIRLRVGDDKTISVAASPWLPRPSTFRLTVPPRTQWEDAWVEDLFTPASSGAWHALGLSSILWM